eukprot:3228629-Rhodomonas_salina.1
MSGPVLGCDIAGTKLGAQYGTSVPDFTHRVRRHIAGCTVMSTEFDPMPKVIYPELFVVDGYRMSRVVVAETWTLGSRYSSSRLRLVAENPASVPAPGKQ